MGVSQASVASQPERTCQTQPVLNARDSRGSPDTANACSPDNDAAVCVESKFKVDALEGFGVCGQPAAGTCRGFHGLHSDTRGTSAWCRLAVKDGRRDPRKYWELGVGQFRHEALTQQTSSQVCPYRDVYQLMRTYLTASELARRDARPFYGAIGIVPQARAGAVSAGVRRFQNRVLLAENADRVAAVDYEYYNEVLDGGSADAKALAEFLRKLL